MAARPSRLVKRRTNAAALQCCGDAHLSNFGVFAAPDRHLVFDLNDLTRRCAAPFEWAVKRLVASFVVAARDNGHRRNEQRAAARAAIRIKQQPPVIVRPPKEMYGDSGSPSRAQHR